jgi:phosphatidylglycerol---prolipoprotein diacylglyceryl transferase
VIPYTTFPLIDLGPFSVRSFGVLVAAGVLFGVLLLGRHVRRHGLDAEAITDLAVKLVAVAFVGSRITWVLTHLDELDGPLDAFAVWNGGLQFSGGFVFAVAYLLWWMRRHPEVPRAVLADGLAYGLTGGLMFGRIGCYAVGEHLGGETSFFLGTEYRGGRTIEGPIEIGTTIHNTSLYEFLGLFVLLIVLTLFLRRRPAPAPGAVATLFALWYGVQRFTTDAFRAYDERTFGLTGAQYLSIALVVVGIALAVRLARRTPSAPAPPPVAAG